MILPSKLVEIDVNDFLRISTMLVLTTELCIIGLKTYVHCKTHVARLPRWQPTLRLWGPYPDPVAIITV